MFGFLRKNEFNEFKEELFGYLQDTLGESNPKNDLTDQERLEQHILKINNPDALEKAIDLYDQKRSFTSRISQRRRVKKYWRDKKGLKDEDEDVEEPEAPQPMDLSQISLATDKIQEWYDKQSPITKGATDILTKVTTGHTVKEIIANPQLLEGKADELKDFIKKGSDKLKEKASSSQTKESIQYVDSTGKSIDPNDPNGYPV